MQKMKDDGWYIRILTGRSWDDYDITLQQISDLPFDELQMGKPIANRTVYIDDKKIDAIHIKRNSGLSGVKV